MKNQSLTKAILGSHYLGDGVISHTDGSLSIGFEFDPFPAGILEENFEGGVFETFFLKLSDLLTKLPNLFEGHIIFRRSRIENVEVPGFVTKVFCFEKVKNQNSYSHLKALFSEIGLVLTPVSSESWKLLLSGVFGNDVKTEKLPDVIWDHDCVRVNKEVVRVLSLTELPQLTWRGCLQPIFENSDDFTLSLHLLIPDRNKIKRQLETKRRVSHALSITSSLEVKNIESNSVLSTSEETLERVLVGKETLFEMTFGLILKGSKNETLDSARNIERLTSGIGNAGMFLEGVGTLPVLKSHIPGNKPLAIRKLPILSGNLSELMPILLDYSRSNDPSNLALRSRSGEVSNLNLFSKENLNFNSFICGASGSGKSFLMNAILSSNLMDDPKSRLCIFDVGGSYRKIIESNGGKSTTLTQNEALTLISSFLSIYPVGTQSFYRVLIETLCGSGYQMLLQHSQEIRILYSE